MPEDLETLLEDAFVLRDPECLHGLFEDDAVITLSPAGPSARGSQEIVDAIAGSWHDGTYLGQRSTLFQSGDTVLAVGPSATSVMRRGADMRWRYRICVLSLSSG